jgi:hypothetical protein
MRIGDTPLGRQISSVLTDPSRLQEFTQWFSKRLWEIESGGDPDMISLARLVENLLYSYLDGDWTAEETTRYLKREVALFGIMPESSSTSTRRRSA